jgi:AcrR family transcriptional regulator
VGPAGIRLQPIADDVGMSHPAILHHFGSRDGLVNAVLARAVRRLRSELVASFENADEPKATELLDRVFDTLGSRGHARLLAWLILTREGDAPAADLGADQTLRRIAEAVHGRRVRDGGGAGPPFEDTLFSMLLGALAIYGDALVGDVMRRSAGLHDDVEADARFREWLARLLVSHLEHRNEPSD